MSFSWARMPFRYRTTQEFESGLTDLISRAFYDKLPAAGLEIREEQIYTAYRIARSMLKGETFFAEAGAGAGKTYAYLIPAVCHARRIGRPVVVACASGLLQNQLADPDGDADTLSRLLDLDVDVRLAGDPQNYVCEDRVEELSYSGVRKKGLARLRRWAAASKRGDRREIPDAPDDLWSLVSWTEGLPCDTCKHRGYCRAMRAREHYRAATDLVVCSHDIFFRDLWSREVREEAGLLPLLPSYSGVVFDEGHRVPDVARDVAGRFVSRDTLERTLRQLEVSVAAVSDYLPHLIKAIRTAEQAMTPFWPALEAASSPSGTGRWYVARADLLGAADRLQGAIEELQDTIALYEDLLESGTRERCYTLQFRLDIAATGLDVILNEESETTLYALDPSSTEAVLWAVPRRIDRRMQQALFSRKVPVIFTSSTLASAGSFDYLKRMVGAPDAGHASAGIPFDFGRQAMVYMPPQLLADPVAHLVKVLEATSGRALVLAGTPGELAALRDALAGYDLPWTMLWEGDADRSSLIRRFRADLGSVLVGTCFWEGVDVPGEALSCVIVPRLPFPPDDPLLEARRGEARRDGLDPFMTVDVPEMALKLKQGYGRLIRTTSDRGVFTLLDVSFLGTSHQTAVETAFPRHAERTGDLSRVREFLMDSGSGAPGNP